LIDNFETVQDKISLCINH